MDCGVGVGILAESDGTRLYAAVVPAQDAGPDQCIVRLIPCAPPGFSRELPGDRFGYRDTPSVGRFFPLDPAQRSVALSLDPPMNCLCRWVSI